MAKATTKKPIDLMTIEPSQIKAYEGLIVKQKGIVKANPYVEITDKETYELAKRRRTALLTASTTVEKEDGAIGKFLNGLKKGISELMTSAAKITRDAHAKQQAELDRYEDILEAERERKRIEKEEADQKVKDHIDEIVNELTGKIESMTFENIDADTEAIEEQIGNHAGTFEEFDILFDIEIKNIREKLADKIEELTDEHALAEVKRVQAHKDRIQRIDLSVKTEILSATFGSTTETASRIAMFIDVKPSEFEEFSDEFQELKTGLLSQWTETVNRLEAEEKTRKENAERDLELAELRKEKLFNDRVKDLKRLEVEERADGEFRHPVISAEYTKDQILAFSEENFAIEYNSIEAAIKRAEEPVAEEPIEEPAPSFTPSFAEPQPEQTSGECPHGADPGDEHTDNGGAILVAPEAEILERVYGIEKDGKITIYTSQADLMAEIGEILDAQFLEDQELDFKVTSRKFTAAQIEALPETI